MKKDEQTGCDEKSELRAEIGRLRAVLLLARRQLITLGGNPQQYPNDDRDMIHAEVIEKIDSALNEYDRGYRHMEGR